MSNPPISSIEAHFGSLPDPRRVDCRTPHKLIDIIAITICAVVCGADNWVAIQAFGDAKYKWLADSWNYQKASRRTIHSDVYLVR